MRWEMLFADLESLADATARAAFEADVADRGRAERAALHLVDRLRGHAGETLTFRLVDGERVRGRVIDVGVDWILVIDDAELLLPLAAVTGVEGLSRRAAADGEALARRVRLTVVLRRLARDRGGVRVRLVDGSVVSGTIDRVGADHLDVALHADDDPRRAALVRGVCVIPITALVQVRAAF